MEPSKKEALVREYMPVVDVIVTQERKKLGMAPGQIDEEMRAYAMEGLAEALTKYDPKRKTVFSTYADLRVRGAIYDGLCRLGWFPRRLRRRINFYRKSHEMIRSYAQDPPPQDQVDAVHTLAGRLKELATAYITTYAADAADEPRANNPEADVLVERKEFRQRINSCMNQLPSTQNDIVRAYFFEDRGLPEIAAQLNISKSWASKLLSSALRAMRKSFGKEHVADAIESFRGS